MGWNLGWNVGWDWWNSDNSLDAAAGAAIRGASFSAAGASVWGGDVMSVAGAATLVPAAKKKRWSSHVGPERWSGHMGWHVGWDSWDGTWAGTNSCHFSHPPFSWDGTSSVSHCSVAGAQLAMSARAASGKAPGPPLTKISYRSACASRAHASMRERLLCRKRH